MDELFDLLFINIRVNIPTLTVRVEDASLW